MIAIKHPDYPQEKQHLDETLALVQRFLDSAKLEAQGADSRSAWLLVQNRLRLIKEMKEAAKEAYVGRVDVLEEENDDPVVYYIGKFGIDRTNVFSWAGTVAADFYYQHASSRSKGELLLKRTLGVTFDKVQSIDDEYVDPKHAKIDRRQLDQYADAMLLALLSEAPRGQLRDIVATIQKQQYQIIQSPHEKLLIVQGVTGSGKTELALHRVAYLLYQHRGSKDFSAKHLLVLGPNPIFLGYISRVLPSLGEYQVPQMTFDEWLIERLGTDVEHEPQEVALEALLNPAISPAERAMRYRNAHNKGSLQMATLLDRYVDILHDELLTGKESLVCTVRPRPRDKQPDSEPVLRAEATVPDLQNMLNNARRLPFNQRRDEVKRQVTAKLRRELRAQIPRLAFRDDGLSNRIESTIKGQVDKYFADWRSLNVSVAYRRLLRNPELLRGAGIGILSDWDLELLTQDAPTVLTPFRFSDLAPLLYLKNLMDGPEEIVYDHIVIDEAQDISPMHFKVLHSYSRAGSMTVLGDLAQGIYPYHGINAWEELHQVTGEQPMLQETIQQSYRSTSQIIDFANAMQQRIGMDPLGFPQPITRHGSPPSLQQLENGAARAQAITKIVQAERENARHSIAIVGKTAAVCRELDAELRSASLADCQLVTERQAQYHGQAVIIPSYLTKGLEFDSVIVADADAASYGPDELDARLLYVVLTRPAHTLYILWIGDITPLLDEQQASIQLSPLLTGGLQPRPLTVEEYVNEHPELDADWCVERLAGAGKLSLLPTGRIDETVLATILARLQAGAQRSDEEIVVEPLGTTARHELNEQVARLEASSEPGVQEALAVTQLAFGLLRNQMRSLGLPVSEDDRTPLAEQVAMLASLFRAAKQSNFSPGIGRWTTDQRALFAVSEACRAAANQRLTQLIDYGIVEETTQGGRSRLRVSAEWIPGLLALSLGYPPADWDPDLLNEIPILPHPLG